MKRSRNFFGLLLIGLFSFNCGGNQPDKDIDLTVAVAANAQFAMEAIELAFEKETNKNIEMVIGSSGKLTAQIRQGAPYDILVAANMKYPNYLYEEGLAKEAPKIYALGELVWWTFDQDLIILSDLSILMHSNVQKIAIANPKNAPYGIAQTNQYVSTQNCEIGFTAKSVVLAPKLKGKGNWRAVPKEAYEPIQQGMIITKYGNQEHAELAQQFYDFLFSSTAQDILKTYGYTIPN